MNNSAQLKSNMWLALCLAIAYSQIAAAQVNVPVGISFVKGSWNDVLIEAKRQHKTIFVDMYTTWCGPCKLMAKQAFPNSRVGEKFNSHFICYQLDAEKGEGKLVARKYAVNAYPTSLYLSEQGDLIHRVAGYSGIDAMLEEADKAITAAKGPRTLSTLEQQYKGGKRDAAFLAQYLTRRSVSNKPDGQALEAYLQAVPETEWTSPKTVELVVGNVTSFRSKAYQILQQQVPLLLKSQDAPARELGQAARMRQFSIINNAFDEAVRVRNEAMLEECIRFELMVFSSMLNQTVQINADKVANERRMRFYQQTRNMDKYRSQALLVATHLMKVPIDSIKAIDEAAYKRFQEQTTLLPDSVKQQESFKKTAERIKKNEAVFIAMDLNDIASTYGEYMTDSHELNQALTWSAKSLEYNRVSSHLNTYAQLLSKLGRKDEAIKVQEEAISLVKSSGNELIKYKRALIDIKQRK